MAVLQNHPRSRLDSLLYHRPCLGPLPLAKRNAFHFLRHLHVSRVLCYRQPRVGAHGEDEDQRARRRRVVEAFGEIQRWHLRVLLPHHTIDEIATSVDHLVRADAAQDHQPSERRQVLLPPAREGDFVRVRTIIDLFPIVAEHLQGLYEALVLTVIDNHIEETLLILLQFGFLRILLFLFLFLTFFFLILLCRCLFIVVVTSFLSRLLLGLLFSQFLVKLRFRLVVAFLESGEPAQTADLRPGLL
mmetsp:Transcript_7839/g.12763  ORF Transcript_7839/g.12763 Transcript_7839/m.12763 type:complete len:245 (-) Transcript_7839:441-1175(-)